MRIATAKIRAQTAPKEAQQHYRLLLKEVKRSTFKT